MKYRSGVGVGVRVGVMVMVGVMLGVFEAVGVGPVAVGKGPIKAPAVRASAVFVLLALRCPLFESSICGVPKIAENKNSKLTNKPDVIKICKMNRFALVFNRKFNDGILLSRT
jgi:hypothetical protein